MDTLQLDELLNRIESNGKRCWLKPIGIPEKAGDLAELFRTPTLKVHFAKQPDGIEIGDLLIVYKIGISKVAFIGECESNPNESTDAELTEKPELSRWHWWISVKNFTIKYGGQWNRHEIKPFALVELFNKKFPDANENIKTIQFGSDKCEISQKFAAFVMSSIMSLPE